MQVEIQNTKADYVKFFNPYFLKQNVNKLFIMLPILLVCSYNASIGEHHSTNWGKFLLLVILFSALLYLLPLLLYIIRLYFTVFKNPSFLASKKIILLDDTITIDSLSRKVVVEVKNIISIYKTTDYIFIKFADKKSILIPTRFFLSAGEAEMFYKGLNSEASGSFMSENNNGTMLTNTKSGRHLYGRGWLGLIPLVGGFVGLGLIILGIFKYKDKKLILIGFAALLFTVAIYSSIFYFAEYSDAGAKLSAQSSQDLLNDLVKDLEFYKQQNGAYPDSLEQLLLNDKLAWIDDPLLTRRPGTENTRFNYKINGDTYLLFSSGIDRIPNTKDDIFPTLKLTTIKKQL